MEGIRTRAVAQEGRLVIEDAAFHDGETFEVFVLPSLEPKRRMTARDLLQSDLVGIWADRNDIGDSVEYARDLRRKVESSLRGR